MILFKKGLFITLINSIIVAIIFLLINVIPSRYALLLIVLPYPIIIIYMFKLKFTNGQRILGSIGTIFFTYGIVMADWLIKKGTDIGDEDIVAFYLIRYLHILLFTIPFFIVVIVCLAKLLLHRRTIKQSI